MRKSASQPHDLKTIFKAFDQARVLVVGDSMIDAYLWGRVERISPEAPVPVVSVTRKESRPGGAANVAINVRAMGATPYLCTVIGDDSGGNAFIRLMKKLRMPVDGVYRSKKRETSVKTRVIGNNHQLLRVDEESVEDLSASDAAGFLRQVGKVIRDADPDVIVFEDYDKGVLNKQVIQKITGMAAKAGIPVAVDPKKKNFDHYRNVDLFKPNLKELREGLKINLENTGLAYLTRAVRPVRTRRRIGMLMVTLSEAGIYFSSDGTDQVIPAHVRNVSDVSGAGDTVISVAALCLAQGLPPALIAALANLAGGQVCEKVGVVPVDKKQLLHEALKAGLH
jgi:rfaE bifunctional protein kinase chain/domain